LRKFPPGDKDAYIKFWNAVMEQLVVSPAETLDQKVATLIEKFESFTDWVHERLAKVEGTIAGLAHNLEQRDQLRKLLKPKRARRSKLTLLLCERTWLTIKQRSVRRRGGLRFRRSVLLGFMRL